MGKTAANSGPAPQAVAALASVLVVVVGAALGVYFIEVRGVGLRVELVSGHGPELGLVGGALVAAGLITFVLVLQLARKARSSSRTRRLIELALETDCSDPDALRGFESIPPLRELVRLLATEKAQGRELGDRVETLRGEMTNLVEGMQRSVLDLGRLREENLSELGQLAVATWNGLVERARAAEAGATAVPVTAAAAPATSSDLAPLAALATRLDELESELARMRTLASPARLDEVAVPEDAVHRPARAVPRAQGAPPSWIESVRAGAGIPAPAAAPSVEFDVAPAPPRFGAPATAGPGEMRFPHFVAKPVRPIGDRIEVSYETTEGDEVVDLPASALLFEDPPEDAAPAVDLRTFGALEIER